MQCSLLLRTWNDRSFDMNRHKVREITPFRGRVNRTSAVASLQHWGSSMPSLGSCLYSMTAAEVTGLVRLSAAVSVSFINYHYHPDRQTDRQREKGRVRKKERERERGGGG